MPPGRTCHCLTSFPNRTPRAAMDPIGGNWVALRQARTQNKAPKTIHMSAVPTCCWCWRRQRAGGCLTVGTESGRRRLGQSCWVKLRGPTWWVRHRPTVRHRAAARLAAALHEASMPTWSVCEWFSMEGPRLCKCFTGWFFNVFEYAGLESTQIKTFKDSGAGDHLTAEVETATFLSMQRLKTHFCPWKWQFFKWKKN